MHVISLVSRYTVIWSRCIVYKRYVHESNGFAHVLSLADLFCDACRWFVYCMYVQVVEPGWSVAFASMIVIYGWVMYNSLSVVVFYLVSSRVSYLLLLRAWWHCFHC